MPEQTFRIVPDKFADNAEQAARVTPRELTALISEILERGRTNIARRTPVGWSGVLRGGYDTEIRFRNTPRVRGAIVNPALYHDPAEEGRRPGKPPPTEAIIPWVASKLGIPPGPERRSTAFLVARAIGRRGTTGAHMVEEGWEETRREIRPRLKQAGIRITRSFR